MLWILLLLPLTSFALISLFLLKRPVLASAVSVGSAAASALAAMALVGRDATVDAAPSWLAGAGLTVGLDPSWDMLARMMTLVVTCVGALIHVYSLGYMRDDPARARFFGFLSLFMFSMMGIVLAGNFVMMFIFWELVGLSSYLLIGFWRERPSAAEAGKKAYLVNKLGDFGFLIGILLVWTIWGTVDFVQLKAGVGSLAARHQASEFSAVPLSLVMLLLFCGAVGKSAQFPLHVWLPDAMEGPTPVSALIHAATMVAAGVYMLCRIFFLISLSSIALTTIAWIGAVTALLAGLWALGQDDIKRILAYSTLSQLGYMVMAVGLASPAAAMFHLTTHAAFKALLFLGAGSVLVALHHEQDIWRMGGLWGRMRWTSATFLVGLLALCGVPFFAGALSKDEILAIAYEHDGVFFGIGAFTAVLTALYMGRLYAVAFLGKARRPEAEHAHESPVVMVAPLVILALFSFGAAWGCPLFRAALESLPGADTGHPPAFLHFAMGLLPVIGFAGAFFLYAKPAERDALGERWPRLRALLASKFGFDELYLGLVRWVQDGLGAVLRWVDHWIVDGLGVKGISLATLCAGNLLRCFQTGNLQTYVFFFGAALAALLYWMLR